MNQLFILQKIIYTYINKIKYLQEKKIRYYLSVPQNVNPPYLKMNEINFLEYNNLDQNSMTFEFKIFLIDNNKSNKDIIFILGVICDALKSQDLYLNNNEIIEIINLFGINYRIYENIETATWNAMINFKINAIFNN